MKTSSLWCENVKQDEMKGRSWVFRPTKTKSEIFAREGKYTIGYTYPYLLAHLDTDCND